MKIKVKRNGRFIKGMVYGFEYLIDNEIYEVIFNIPLRYLPTFIEQMYFPKKGKCYGIFDLEV